MNSVWLWLLPLGFCAPWIVGIVWLWRRVPADGWIPQSYGDHLRERVLQR
jgi:hypothetical protein